MKHLGILLRVHRRHACLRRIFKQFNQLTNHTRVTVVVLADRATDRVNEELEVCREVYPDLTIQVETSPCPLVSGSGELYMTALKTHHNLGRKYGCSHFVVWDDDFWMSKKLFDEVVELAQEWPSELDVTYVKSLFLWNHADKHNTKLPEHWQHFIWRDVPYTEFTPRMMVHCPERLVREGSLGHHEGALINAGYQHAEDRQSTFERYRRAGKLDPFTFALLAEPKLEALND